MRSRAALFGPWIFVSTLLPGCDTDAVGVEDCREIERARCEAAVHCDLGIETEDDVEECKRFARDNCLHGFAVDESASSTELRECVEVIKAAAGCAEAASPDVGVRDCSAPTLETVASRHTACEVVETPEISLACAFLVPEPPEPDQESSPEPDAGGSDPPGDAG